MPELKPCPFCGSNDIAIDTLKGIVRVACRVQCQTCFSASCFSKREEEAVLFWNRRPGEWHAKHPDFIIGKNHFYFEGIAYECDPRTGYCYLLPDPMNETERAGIRWKRIAQAEYAEKLKACKKKITAIGRKP
ncbi:MAG: Lar family restriction alleviation protein [Treponema sp.]|jgi:Lar family restriction alleviation protein|nr:Lar family restriction alleviation protein [Treponema sp.]